MRSDKIEFANACRGVAALSVVVIHILISFWLHPVEAAALLGLPPLTFDVPGFATALEALPLNFAAFGVALFFVVSGFVIPISLERYDAKAFLAGRLVRIWPTYWAGFSATVAAMLAGAALWGGTAPFNTVQAIVHYFPPLRALVYSKPIDGIIWTLEIEFFWYGLAACLAGGLRRGAIGIFLAPVGLFALFGALYGFSLWRPDSLARVAGRLEFLMIYAPFVIFIFTGVALNFRQRGLVSRPVCAALIGLCLALFFAAWWTGLFAGIIAPGSYLAALAVFVAVMAFQDRFSDGPVLRYLARISYPLYVVHGMAGYILLYGLMQAGLNAWLATALVLAAVILAADLLHRFIERPSHALAQRVSRALTHKMPAFSTAS
jgi:peptidoglycan/LPS O-acetylase OafA/YrhL